MKRLQGLIAATIITVLVGFGMLAIGVNAASNPDSAPVSDSPSQASTVSSTAAPGPAQAQITQLQSLIKQYQDREKQYQDREKQYQSELSSVSQKLSDATAEVDQLQQILIALQQRGVIRISNDGRISIPQG